VIAACVILTRTSRSDFGFGDATSLGRRLAKSFAQISPGSKRDSVQVRIYLDELIDENCLHAVQSRKLEFRSTPHGTA
jgi:hypothetical protein